MEHDDSDDDGTKSNRLNKIVHNNLNHLIKNPPVVVNKENKLEAMSPAKAASLYTQHKELLRNRYAFSSSTKATDHVSPVLSLEQVSKEDADGLFSLHLQNAMRTSSSFAHVQARRNIRIAQAA
jgi:hypothetical protein